MDDELIALQSTITDRGFRAPRGTGGFLNPSGASIIMMDPDSGEMQTHGKCLRQRWYQHNNTPPDIVTDLSGDLNSKFRMQMGNVISDAISDGFKQMGLLVGTEEQVILPDRRISGRVDRITRHPQHGTYVGWEDKCYFTYYSIKMAFGNAKEPPKTKIEHKMQTAIYAWGMEDYGISDWRILHTDVSGGRMRMDRIRVLNKNDVVVNDRPEPWTMQDIFDREDHWWKLKGEPEPPARDYKIAYEPEKLEAMAKKGELSKWEENEYSKGRLKKGDWQCRFCQFAGTCYGEE